MAQYKVKVHRSYQNPLKYGRSVDLQSNADSPSEKDCLLGYVTISEADLNHVMGRSMTDEVVPGEAFTITIEPEPPHAG